MRSNTLPTSGIFSANAGFVMHTAENTAAATEEVTASSEELTALMNTVNENCNKMHNISIDLVNDLNRFTV